ncbi:hypothetical protein PYCCODRAFT_1436353 [Trametes coccinea BRFM310]|uniref:DUF6533 domain-containing protein n=1 Tax=Trametes coccinea (strain BRFM310) TaxID=1353009 RepID=A0A1Y2IJV9_TRAC3|nr:hypothetical protein PYCCODRAFT_1436353 [Trametes coccinea BRFM310]
MTESDVLGYVITSQRRSMHSLASAVWLLYDLLTTFDQEVEFVWRSNNSLPKFLYFVSRYVGLFGQFVIATAHLPIFCRGELMSSLVILACMIFSIELSLMLRIDALYGRSRRVRALLFTAFIAEIASAATINGFLYPEAFRRLRPFPPEWPVQGCHFPDDIFLNKLVWLPVVAFETLLFCLNTIKCISYGPLDHHTPLIYRLFRDGSVYFAIALAVMLICTIAQFTNNSPLSTVTAVWISAVLSYSGCHLLLSVRSVAARREQLDLALISVHVSDICAESETVSPLDSAHRPSPTPQLLSPPPRLSLSCRVRSIEVIPGNLAIIHGGKSEEFTQTQTASSSDPSTPGRSESGSETIGGT